MKVDWAASPNSMGGAAQCHCTGGRLPPRSGDKYILSTYLEFTAKPA
ncbi:hypothetical protein [Xanthomonas sacchari]|nr:hypothetical protein [Xanthomonas sacchari]MCW0376950.1 hypothetical protein [Xanthomonas sacchari]MCW0389359.1 hypothetical protein [Xanthomonas sacchari]